MLNTSLTVEESSPNCHQKYWKLFSDMLIKYISTNTTNIVFVLWGGPALKKLSLIDETKHSVVISSHPSGLSCNKKLEQYSSFNNSNPFKAINDYLVLHLKEPIDWKLK
jgi:uracil-DNA glycosylase